MKRLWVFIVFFLLGCSNKQMINCNFTDYSSIYGSKKVVDKLVFNSNNLVSFERNINIGINDGIKIKNIYKSLKLEGKSFKKLMNGKYKINRSDNNVNLILKTQYTDNLSYIGINGDYDTIKAYYSDIGFNCK